MESVAVIDNVKDCKVVKLKLKVYSPSSGLSLKSNGGRVPKIPETITLNVSPVSVTLRT